MVLAFSLPLLTVSAFRPSRVPVFFSAGSFVLFLRLPAPKKKIVRSHHARLGVVAHEALLEVPGDGRPRALAQRVLAHQAVGDAKASQRKDL